MCGTTTRNVHRADEAGMLAAETFGVDAAPDRSETGKQAIYDIIPEARQGGSDGFFRR